MSRITVTGKSPGGQPCPRCGKVVGIWWNGKFVVVPKHKTPSGKPCRANNPPRPDLDRKIVDGKLLDGG